MCVKKIKSVAYRGVSNNLRQSWICFGKSVSPVLSKCAIKHNYTMCIACRTAETVLIQLLNKIKLRGEQEESTQVQRLIGATECCGSLYFTCSTEGLVEGK